MVACIFPGQGSQYVGMAADFHAGRESARAICDRADQLLGFPLSRICFEGPEDTLRRTEFTQPAIFLHSMVAADAYRDTPPSMVAGHSLGEYSALVMAGALSFEDGLRLVRLRGQLMQRAGEEQQGTMAAVVGLTMEEVTSLCGIAGAKGIVQPANFNSPGQVVISGSVEGVRAAMELAKERGARMVKELVVSGAFHSPLMESARAGLTQALASTDILDARIPVYSNVTAGPVRERSKIRQLLAEQLTNPVRWEESIRAMIHAGAKSFVELGPGKVLRGLVQRIDGTITLGGIDKLSDVKA